ncbi:MAG: iron export ABC transporter permease subunit FetB [Gammaproteobacteria bacterium]|nr:iron export ABC transporter permease subunit FetB [Gammaproteobacteria bacterium]
MTLIPLTPWQLALAAVLLLILVMLSIPLRLQLGQQMVVAAVRTTVQLLLVGLVLEIIFGDISPLWILFMALFMVLAAGYEVHQRQHYRLTHGWGLGIGTGAMFISSFSITLIALTAILNHDPWYEPQYAIPLLGMLLGNTMNGISLGLDRLNSTVWQQRYQIEARLLMGHSANDAIGDIRRDSIRTGLIPIINSMAAAGIISLPGMMTGQILSGTSPMEAVKYQILIMFLIAAGTGYGTIAAVTLGSRRLFDDRQRLRLDRLRPTT